MNKPSIHEKGQSGQAIVLIALTMVILLGAVGLAIDGGGMFLLYRDAQNAVDSASLSAAFALCTDDDPIAQAYRTLDLNGFDPTDAGVTITVNHPPQNTGNPDYDNDNHLQIILNAEKPSYFIQAVYQGPLVINVEAISFCEPGSPNTSASPERERAMTSLRDADECTTSPGWDIAGSQFTIEGDVWMPNINPNIEFNSDNTPDPTVEDNPADILGNIFVGRSSADQAIVDGTGRELLVEDLPNSPAGDDFLGVYSGHGGNGTIDFSQPAPANPLPWDMDYFRPGGQLDLDNAAYVNVDLTNACDDGDLNQGDYNQSGRALSGYYDQGSKTWTPGIYYSTCQIHLDTEGMNGNVTWISEGPIYFNSKSYTFTAYEDAPLAVSNYRSNADYNDCTGSGIDAIYFNAVDSTMTGPVVAFEGTVALAGTGYTFNTCITAVGINQDGNSDSIYRCVPGQDGFEPNIFGRRR